jgi:CRP/FNR family transcriptional regulator, cyclic AMP receptor protein
MDPVDALLRTPIFRELARSDIEELLPVVRELRFARGEQVWGEGAPATELYVVAEGQLKAYRVSREGGELILKVMSSGEITGEVGLFHPAGVRWVCVGAMERSVCFTVPREELLAFMTRHPIAMRRMLESLSELNYLSDVAFEDIRRRVARTLLALAAEQGELVPSGVRIRLKLSQTTLAAMVAATRENVNRALATFISRGDVSQQEGFFFVHDREALEGVVSSG